MAQNYHRASVAAGDIAIRNVHRLLEEATNVIHGDEGRGR
jgi:hypothetical protein